MTARFIASLFLTGLVVTGFMMIESCTRRKAKADAITLPQEYRRPSVFDFAKRNPDLPGGF